MIESKYKKFNKSKKNLKTQKPKTTELYYLAQEKYSKIYGEKAIVFFQIGKFYEAYCTKNRGYINLEELEQLLNIHFIRRDNRVQKNGRNKPNQFGINIVSIKRNLITLIDNGYTIILFDERKNGKEIERFCSGVYSPGTFLSDNYHNSNYNLSVYIVEERQLTNKKNLMAIGLTLLDITTGKSIVHEFYSSILDEKFGLDELVRVMQIYNPTETIIYLHPQSLDEDSIKNIKSYLELEKYKNLQFYIYYDKKSNDQLNLLSEEAFKISYQNEYLSNIYDLKSSQLSLNKKQSIIEIMGIEKNPYIIISLIIMLKYISKHNISLLKNISFPEIYVYNKHLILGNNAIDQLNILDSGGLEIYNRKIKSLFDVINKTVTPMGKRFLKESLLNPFSQENKHIILDRYNIIDILLRDKFYIKIKQELTNICDIERFHRRMALGIILPHEFYKLDTYYQATNNIISHLKNTDILKNFIEDSVIKEFLEYQIKYNSEYDFEKMQNFNNFCEINSSFFKQGINKKIDSIQEKMDNIWSLINGINSYFTNIILSQTGRRNDKEILEAESNERDGYYFTINRTNEKILKKELSNKKDKIKVDLSIGNMFTIIKKNIQFKQLTKGRTKIFIPELVEYTVNLEEQKTELIELIEEIFIKSMLNYYKQHQKMLRDITKFVAEIDFLVSGSIVADSYYYCRPQIPSSGNIPSYLIAKDLRHSIIERLLNETEYVPNNIELGNVPNDNIKTNAIGKNGMIVFSINGSGKCLDPDTDVMMIDGSTKKARYIQTNDMLMGDDSTPRNVLSICQGKDIMYRIIPVKGDPYTVNGAHILCLKSCGYKDIVWEKTTNCYRAIWMDGDKYCFNFFHKSKYGTKRKTYSETKKFLKPIKSDKGRIVHISVNDYLKKSEQWKKKYWTYHTGVDFADQALDYDPYILGCWLGSNWKQSGNHFYLGDDTYQYLCQNHNLMNYIPRQYLCNSRANRLKMLAGIIDSSFSIHRKHTIEMRQDIEQLANDIVCLTRSLGFFCTKTKCTDPTIYYKINMQSRDFTEIPLMSGILVPSTNSAKIDYQMYPFKIRKLGMGDYNGFTVDGNHRFLLGDFTVTHNSSLMKSIGIAIILAQIGYYVPASEFIYEPYMALYARITGNDNIFKGLSSFALEMSELDSILVRTELQGPNTLVIGDEICRGTEDISGRAIVASAIVNLSKYKSSFIFSSHLHDIQYIDEIKQLTNLRMCHLRVEYDEENSCLIYNRKLTPGSGPSVYGLMVARYLIKNKEFINRAEIIKKRLMTEDKNDIPIKTSNYNNDLLVTSCSICGYFPVKETDKELESHHIHFQKDCWADGKIKEKPYLSKNMLYNLVVLCRKCHDKVHREEIIIKGYMDTSRGPLLDYSIDNSKNIIININRLQNLEKLIIK